jgi:TRAP-type mannitol/chloroaromatic compound transport system permease small subunit
VPLYLLKLISRNITVVIQWYCFQSNFVVIDRYTVAENIYEVLADMNYEKAES